MNAEITFHKNPEALTAVPLSQVMPELAMSIQLETITPEIAQQLLDGNTDNRPCADRHVKFLADQMRAGAWQTTGDPIKISPSGRLLDGQHRLRAIIQSETTQLIYVARDCAEEIFSVLDTGRNRTAGDVLATAGLKNYNNLAATVKLLLLHEKGTLGNTALKKKATTHTSILEWIRTHPGIEESAAFGCGQVKGCRLLNVGEWAALHYLLGQVHPVKATEFLHQIRTGLNLTEGHPVFLLRNKLQQARDGRFNFTSAERMALTVKAWNVFRAGQTISQLTWKNFEAFPEIV